LKGLLYNHTKYLIRNGITEDCLFSSGMFWATYRYVKDKSLSAYTEPLNDSFYDIDEKRKDLLDSIKNEEGYFRILLSEINIKAILKKMAEVELKSYSLEKRDTIVDIICYCFINRIDTLSLFTAVDKYVKGVEVDTCENTILEFISPYISEGFFRRDILHKVKWKLFSLGHLRESNIYVDLTLKDLILLKAKEGSFTVHDHLKHYLRLANHEQRVIDIENIWMFYYMYHNRKDYTVISFPDALITFERHGLASECFSTNLISDVMEQSEKGIRHIMNRYVDMKCDTFVTSDVMDSLYKNDNLDIFDLFPQKISLLPKERVIERMLEVLNYHYHSKNVDFSSIREVLNSVYMGLILEMIRYHGYSIFNVDDERFHFLPRIDVLPSVSEERKIRNPMEHGYISEECLDFLMEKGLDCVEISRFPDGWNACFTVLDRYNHFPKEELRKHIEQIIHSSMFARYSDMRHIGRWEHFLGNLPKFLSDIEFDADWDRLFAVFMMFSDLSLVPHDIAKNMHEMPRN